MVIGGRVALSTTLDATPDRVWELVVGTEGAARWWGLLDGDLTHVAQECCLRTGSSSFYRLWVEALEPRRELDLVGAYLGVLPTSRIRFRLEPVGVGRTSVHLTEDLTADDPASLGLAEDLWRSRLALLGAALDEPGARTETSPDGGDIRLEQELPTRGWRPLHPTNVTRWLPVSGPGYPPRWFHVVDTAGARPFRVTSWRARYDDRLDLGIALMPDVPPSRAEITISVTDDAVSLGLRHTGWDDSPDLDGEIRQILRLRFLATWRHALTTAARSGP